MHDADSEIEVEDQDQVDKVGHSPRDILDFKEKTDKCENYINNKKQEEVFDALPNDSVALNTNGIVMQEFNSEIQHDKTERKSSRSSRRNFVVALSDEAKI